MTFEEILEQALAMLQRRGRVSYRALQRQFGLDAAYLEDVTAELLYAHPEVLDDAGQGLAWTGAAPPAAPAPATAAPAPRTYTPPYLTARILASRSALEGERKQVTVLFADLKGSMELLADRDPEEARRILDPVLERLMAAVQRYEGTVNQVLGDGIMALFGAPLTHEDHAARACYAALAMQAAIRAYAEEVRRTQGLALQIRVGLNSGEVVVRAIGNDLHMDYSAIGQTTHLAARMEQLATPGTILLTAATLRLVEGLVQVQALGPVPVRGLVEPVQVYELRGVTAWRGRLQAAAGRGLTRFVGRASELTALQQTLERAGQGRGQVVAVVGEAGVGKSRLVYELVHSHRTQGWRVLESASVSYGQATPYVPVIDLLKRYARVEEHDDVRTVRARVTGQVLTLDEALQETIPALLSLLDALPEDNPFARLDPLQRRHRLLDALKRLLLRESQVQPLLVVFEDLHWIDTETQALLDSLVESLPTARMLLLVNYRPEYQHAWSHKTHYTQLRLDPLLPASTEELLQALLGEDASLAPLTPLLIQRTAGNPFFLEESVRTLVETGVLTGARGAYRLTQPLESLQVPATVQAVLAARLDRLPADAKHLLQTAAVIGTEVPLPLLQAIADLSEETLHGSLAHLQAAEFLYETSLFPEHTYTFTHALTHQVTYGSLLHERRRTLHARIVEALEGLYAGRLAEQSERLAHHAIRGEVWDTAAFYLRQAGARAMGRSAYPEAVACYEHTLVALTHLPEDRETLTQAIDVRLDLSHALRALGEYGRMLECLRQAEPLVEAIGDQRRLGWIAHAMTVFFWQGADQAHALETGQRALTLATSLGDVGLQVVTSFRLGQVAYALGDYRRAVDLFTRNVALLDGELWRECFGQAFLPAADSYTWLVYCLGELGEFAEGLSLGEEGMRMAEAANHLWSRLVAHSGIGRIYLCAGDLQKAIPQLERSVDLCQGANIRHLFPWVATPLGSAYAQAGRCAEALSLLTQVVEHAAAIGLMVAQAFRVGQLSEAYLLADRIEDAIPLARSALELSRAYRERGHEAHALAEELGMRPLQAHCHRGLGTLYARTGPTDEARTALAMAMALYRSMHMTFWLPQTEAALTQVNGNVETGDE